jgi:hypothetical protein
VSDEISVIKSSTNVSVDVQFTAMQHKLPPEKIDFDLLGITTYYKKAEYDDWAELEGNDLLKVATETELRSMLFHLRQEYQIRLHLAKPAHQKFNLIFSIAADKTRSKVVALIDPASLIPMKKGVQKWIRDAIYNKKLRAGFFVGICDGDLVKEINKMLLKIQKEGSLKQPYRLPIGECFPPVQPVNDAVLLHYKKIKRENNLIDAVQPDDLILEYIRPKYGQDGRSCNGTYIPVSDPLIKYAAQIKIDEKTIRTVEEDDTIRYYALISGFVQRKDGVFTVSQELQIEMAGFKQTGSIEAGIDKEIHVTIKNQEHSKDAVGTGITIDVQKLDISGTVGRNATIQANELTVGAQTHKKSNINVTDVATIHLHRGNLIAKEANIEILEAGIVEADTVRVKTMVGGEIIAREVYVDTLYSNAKITALELIEIQYIKGEGNNLIIDPHAIETYHEQIDTLEKDIQARNSQLQEETKEYVARQHSFKDKNARMVQFQKRLVEAKKNGTQPMKADVLRIQQYRAEAENLKEISEKLSAQEETIRALTAELDKFYDADLHACITHHHRYNGHTRVIFIDPKTRQEYAITPKGKVTNIRLLREENEKRLLLESN